MQDVRIDGDTVTFWLRVRPGSRRQRLRRNSEGELCLEVAAPPVEGRANDACVLFLARALRLRRHAVSILAGHSSRRKLIRVQGCAPAETIARLESLSSQG